MSNLPPIAQLAVESNEATEEPIPATINEHSTGLASVNDQNYIVSSLPNEKEHPYYNVLLGRRKKVLKNSDSIGIVTSLIDLPRTTFISSMIKDDQQVQNWYYNNSVHTRFPHKWTLTLITKSICGFNDILTKEYSLVAGEKQYPKEVQQNTSYMEELREAAEIAKNDTVRDSTGTVGSQKSVSRV